MGTRKLLPDPISFDGGLNLLANPFTKKPNEWSACQNVIVAKPYGFKTGNTEENHVAQSRPPMRTFFNSPFDVAIANNPTEIKPLVGATQTAADDQPQQWQPLVYGTASEGWTATYPLDGSTPHDLIDFPSPGLTFSDMNNNTVQLRLKTNGNGGVSDQGKHDVMVTLPAPYTSGNIGNYNTKIFVDYTELYQGPFGRPLDSLVMRVGIDSSNYLEYTLPVNAIVTNAVYAYFTNRFSVNLRNFNSKVGTKNFGEIVSNMKFFWFFAHVPNDSYNSPTNYQTLFTIDHIRLDVDYNGFFGDFTVGQAYRQISIPKFELSNPASFWTLGSGFYPERRLSMGNNCLAFEGDVSGVYTGSTSFGPIDSTVSGFPQTLMLDYRVENHGSFQNSASSFWIRIGSTVNDYYEWDFSQPASDGNKFANVVLGTLTQTGSPNPANLNYLQVGVRVSTVAEPNSARLYLSNLRFGPYTSGTRFPIQSGNIRDTYLYDPTDVGASTRFLTSCGDTLFIGTGLLSSNSWYVSGAFTNWSPSNQNLPQRFVFATVTNPAFIEATTLNGNVSAGASSIVLTSATNLNAGQQVVIDPNGASPELNYVASSYVAGSTTVPLTSPLINNHSSGSTVTWENTAEPKNQVYLVNGVDGLYSVDIFSYPLGGGSVYQYPRFTKIAPEAYSSVIVHKGYLSLVGDPNNPNRTVLAPISGLPTIPAQSFIELDTEGTVTAGDKITSQWSFEKYLLTIRKMDVWITYGDSINNFTTERTSAFRGALSQNHIAQAGRRLFFFAYDGVYEFSGMTTVKISDNINPVFQTNDLTKMQSGFLFYNPIREMLMCAIPRNYTADPLTATTGTVDVFTYSMEKAAWGRIFWIKTSSGQTVIDPRYTVFSAVFYGGGASIPSVFLSSTTMIEMDSGVGTDSIPDQFYIQTVPNGFGNQFQEKVFDKLYLWAKNLSLTNANLLTAQLQLIFGFNNFNSQTLALYNQMTPDADGLLELFAPSGSWGKACSLNIRGVYSSWETPIQLEMFGISHWTTQEL